MPQALEKLCDNLKQFPHGEQMHAKHRKQTKPLKHLWTLCRFLRNSHTNKFFEAGPSHCKGKSKHVSHTFRGGRTVFGVAYAGRVSHTRGPWAFAMKPWAWFLSLARAAWPTRSA